MSSKKKPAAPELTAMLAGHFKAALASGICYAPYQSVYTTPPIGFTAADFAYAEKSINPNLYVPGELPEVNVKLVVDDGQVFMEHWQNGELIGKKPWGAAPEVEVSPKALATLKRFGAVLKGTG